MKKKNNTKSKKKSGKTCLIITVLLLIPLILCMTCSAATYLIYIFWQEHQDDGEPLDLTTSGSMETFASNKEFDNYIEELQEEIKEQSENEFGVGEEPYTAEEATTGEEESITNIQEAGVDEGDIVKAYKDYLVILRRGKLFSIQLEDENTNIIEPVSEINAYPEGFTQGTWYDEMLIYNDTIVVIGYSYELSATELEFFTIDSDGQITHDSAYFIDSNDYYSSRNYASRLSGGKLIFYMPYYLFTWDYVDGDYERKVSLPQIRKWIEDDELSSGEDILSKTDIYKPLQNTYYPTLHTIMTCDLDSRNFDCEAKAILGPYSRSFYVSTDAIYVWVSKGFYWYEEEETDNSKSSAYVYRFQIDDLSAKVLRADGSPIDQFSFKEADGYLNVLVTENISGDAMWDPEMTSGDFALFRTKLSNFSSQPDIVSRDNFTPLEAPEGYTVQNRFVEDYLLYGSGSSWWEEQSENTLYVKNYTDTSSVQEVELTHSTDRIDIMDDYAVVVGSDDENLKFSSIKLSSASSVVDTYIIEKAVQGETRSHGFFYKSLDDDTGILGLPIRKEGEGYEQLFDESAEVVFLKVNSKKEFSTLGSLEANPPERENDDCEVSCVDWYGNSRPIFYSSRIFALMGYELVEGEIINSKLSEIERVNYL